MRELGMLKSRIFGFALRVERSAWVAMADSLHVSSVPLHILFYAAVSVATFILSLVLRMFWSTQYNFWNPLRGWEL
jgi:hypothetical protein